MTGPRIITVEFPTLPYSELRPNYHRTNFWGKRKEVTAIAREEALLTALALKIKTPVEICTIEEVFFLPTRRRIDLEGMISACKPWIDGLVDAGLIVEDDVWHVVRLTGVPEYRKGQEGTRIVVTEVVKT